MKKIQLSAFILFFFVYVQVFSQEKENKFFVRAYKYLKNNELKRYENLSIADSVVYIEYSLCFDMLKQNSGNEKYLLDSLDKIDKERLFKAYYTDMGRIQGNSKTILFFSRPYKKTLLVEMFDSPQTISSDYKKNTRFGNSTLFLIYFNRFKKVKKSTSIKIDYN